MQVILRVWSQDDQLLLEKLCDDEVAAQKSAEDHWNDWLASMQTINWEDSDGTWIIARGNSGIVFPRYYIYRITEHDRIIK